MVGQGPDGGQHKQIGQGEAHLEPFVDLHGRQGEAQRVTAELEKIVIYADEPRFCSEDSGPNTDQSSLDFVPGRGIFAPGSDRMGFGQGA